jgi:hypothetical protein
VVFEMRHTVVGTEEAVCGSRTSFEPMLCVSESQTCQHLIS